MLTLDAAIASYDPDAPMTSLGYNWACLDLGSTADGVSTDAASTVACTSGSATLLAAANGGSSG
eukprot:5224734-Prymnesium_polylepis.1